MSKFLKLLISIPAFICAFLLSACAGSRTDKYKITVNVEVGGKKYSGSTVQYQKSYNGADWAAPIGGGGGVIRKGEAVVVNVDGKYLFLLWNYSVYKDSNYELGFNKWHVNDVWERWNSGYRYPFVTFTDVNDPLTVKKVTPENLEQYFGEGAKITSIEVQRTIKPVTYGKVEQVIPWIMGSKKELLFASDGNNYNIDNYYSNLSIVQFIRE